MSDRIGVMNEGTLLQVGRPEEIYESPASRFVADFIGEINLLQGRVVDPTTVELAGGRKVKVNQGSTPGSEVVLAIRPERLGLHTSEATVPERLNRVGGTVTRRVYFGDVYYYDVDIGLTAPVEVKEENRPGVELCTPGARVWVAWDPAAATVVAE